MLNFTNNFSIHLHSQYQTQNFLLFWRGLMAPTHYHKHEMAAQGEE